VPGPLEFHRKIGNATSMAASFHLTNTCQSPPYKTVTKISIKLGYIQQTFVFTSEQTHNPNYPFTYSWNVRSIYIKTYRINFHSLLYFCLRFQTFTFARTHTKAAVSYTQNNHRYIRDKGNLYQSTVLITLPCIASLQTVIILAEK
jgi:hypothetical protein